MQNTTYIYSIKEHNERHPHNTENMQENLLLVYINAMPVYKGVPRAQTLTESQLFLFCSLLRDPLTLTNSTLSLSLLSLLPDPIKMRSKLIFYMRGLSELFPPIYLPYSITLNGLSSPQIRSRSQPYKH
jgi:hypothetical protein